MNSQSPASLSDEEEDDLFYFESDHLALRGNKDYSEVLKTIFILESQFATAVKDYDAVVEIHKQALVNPLSFVEKFKKNENLGIPELQVIAEVPNIDWSSYNVPLPEEGLKFINDKSSQTKETLTFASQENYLRSKRDTHNKPWTTEEQKRLEELLVIYPPEPIEFRRFKKIAAALGNRTVKQVSSRIQKYFLKLYKAGLPIPGRVPKYAERTKKSKLHMHQRFNHYLFKPTTFFPELDIPVTMNESEEVPGPSSNSTSSVSFSNYLMPHPPEPDTEQKPPEEPKSDLEIQLEILKKVKYDKQNEDSLQAKFRHVGFRCDYCDEEPIVGTRWHCLSCVAESIDFCSDCIVSQMYSVNPHPISHKLHTIQYENVCMDSNIAYTDSSDEDASGSALGSSHKNFESSNISSSSDSDGEQCEDETQNSLETYENAGVQNEQENEDEFEDEEEEDLCEIKTENALIEEDNLNVKYSSGQDNIHEMCPKEEVYVLQEDALQEPYDVEMTDAYKFHVVEPSILCSNSSILETEDCNSIAESINVTQCEDQFNSDAFTETQNISYSYLHSNLLLDNNT